MRRIEVLEALKLAYEQRHFTEDIFDLKSGYLQTSVGGNEDKMPLQFFVDYNNIWWFPLLYRIEVNHVAYDEASETGGIAFDVTYGDENHKSEALPAMQRIQFSSDDTVNQIRTFASSSFWEGSSHPGIQLDGIGNQIWLETGYSMEYSAKAALLMLQESPVGKHFASLDALKTSIEKIIQNLRYYEDKATTQWQGR